MGGCVSRQTPRPGAVPVFDSLPLPPAAQDEAGAPAALPLLSPNSQFYSQQRPASANGNGTPVVQSNVSSRNSSLKRLYQVNNNNATPPPTQQYSQVVAMFDYLARNEDEVTFCAGDVMYLLSPVVSDWWFVEHKKTRACGYAPAAFVAFGDSLESKSWFAGPLPRKEAERLLLSAGNPTGTFLVRESGTVRESYSLSVLDYNEETGRDVVKHYRLKMLDSAGGCCIATRYPFPSVQALIDSYSHEAAGLCCRLTAPCPRPKPTLADLSYQFREQWEVPRHQFELTEQLGSGQFGDVWRGVFNGRFEVAVKMLKAGSMSRADFLKEARIMKQLRHPKLVQLFAVCTVDDPVFIVTELMSHGSLLTHLRDSRPRLDQVAQVEVLAQVASGMAYLEAERFIHRDLAARNILVGERNSVKVADFGLSRAIGDSDSGEYTARQGSKFPIKWTSPEAALQGRFSIKSDVWSFGIVIFEVATHGQIPYAGLSNTETLTAVQAGYRMPQPPECPDQVYDLMLRCWDAAPESRPSFAQLTQYFEDFIPAGDSAYRDPLTPQIV